MQLFVVSRRFASINLLHISSDSPGRLIEILTPMLKEIIDNKKIKAKANLRLLVRALIPMALIRDFSKLGPFLHLGIDVEIIVADKEFWGGDRWDIGGQGRAVGRFAVDVDLIDMNDIFVSFNAIAANVVAFDVGYSVKFCFEFCLGCIFMYAIKWYI